MSDKAKFPTTEKEARAYEIEKATGFVFDMFCIDPPNTIRLEKRIGNCDYVMYAVNQPGPLEIVEIHVHKSGERWQKFVPST